MKNEIVVHPLNPIYNKKSKILLLGSMPSLTSRKNNFYYAHPQNQFWTILEKVFNEKINNKKEFIINHHLALWDVIKKCEIKGSSDASIKNVEVNDIKDLIDKSNIEVIFTIGKTATKFYKKYVYSKTGVEAIPLPSTSPAYQKMKLEEKIKEFKKIKFYL